MVDIELSYASGWVGIDDVEVNTATKYYYSGGTRIALRDNGQLRWLLGDHLGSTSYAATGTVKSGEVRYKPWGVTRYSSGSIPTTYRYTGQREEASLGLYYYGARWYDPALGRFIQPDTVVPDAGDAKAFDRYAYVNDNPLRYNDPTGHYSNDEIKQYLGCSDWNCVEAEFGQNGTYAGLIGWLHILQQAQDGDVIYSYSGPTGHGRDTLQGTFQRTSEGQIQIIYGQGNISSIHGGDAISEKVFAYYGAGEGGSFAGHYKLDAPDGSSRVYVEYPYRRHLPTLGETACQTWDCTALGYDAASLGLSFSGDVAIAGAVESAGLTGIGTYASKTADASVSLASMVHTLDLVQQGKANAWDVRVQGVTTGMSTVPGLGEVAGIVQLIWDLADPFHQ